MAHRIKPLLGFDEAISSNKQTGLPFRFKDYVQFVDWIGRAVRADKRGVINNKMPVQTYCQTTVPREGKGRKDRFVPISPRALEWLQRYLDEVRIGFAIEPDSQNVFLEKNGQPLLPDRLSRLVTKYIKQADTDNSGSCHLFCHTVATLMMDNGADIRFIQQMLGHASINTTEIYTHVSIVKLKQIHEMAHPTMRRPQQAETESEATEEALLLALEEEKVDDESLCCYSC